MYANDVEHLLQKVADGKVSVHDALHQLRVEPFTDLGYAKVDHHRALRQNAAEVIYGAGKTPEQILGIVQSLRAAGQETVLITRMKPEAVALLQAEAEGTPAEGLSGDASPAMDSSVKGTSADAASVDASPFPFTYYDIARVGIVGSMPVPDGNGCIVVAAAGTSDLPVAEEAALTAEALGNEVQRLYDVGVAGLHRLLAHVDDIVDAQVIIAVAGMEGALASVIGGMASCPVIAVPTSVGYGASFQGLAALLSMLNSCASGVSVVNIDNGFGAGFQAHTINHLPGRARN